MITSRKNLFFVGYIVYKFEEFYTNRLGGVVGYHVSLTRHLAAFHTEGREFEPPLSHFKSSQASFFVFVVLWRAVMRV
jgi:hypothetical protein